MRVVKIRWGVFMIRDCEPSRRWLGLRQMLRAFVHELRRVSPSSKPEPSPAKPKRIQEFMLDLIDKEKNVGAIASLDAVQMHSLREMFLLLDEWDRGQTNKQSQKIQEFAETSIDRENE